jgi:hypothetical protein
VSTLRNNVSEAGENAVETKKEDEEYERGGNKGVNLQWIVCETVGADGGESVVVTVDK